MDSLQMPVTCSESFVYVSQVNIHVNEHVSVLRMKRPCVIVYRQDSQNA